MSFLGRIFGAPRSGGPVDPEGWEVGDLAECIMMGKWYARPDNTPTSGPRHGQTMRVTGVHVVRDACVPGGRVLALSFAGWPNDYFGADAFRKLRPRADEAAAAEAEFTALVRRPPAPPAPTHLPDQPKIEEFQ